MDLYPARATDGGRPYDWLLRLQGHASAHNPKYQSTDQRRASVPGGDRQSSNSAWPVARHEHIIERDSGANSSYNALWLTVDKRLAKGLQFNASYTYSKSIDYNSQNGQGVTVQDSYNIQGDRGLSDYDARNRFVIHLL